jgi:hypothetical protein
MSNNVFADEWRECLEEHYKYVVQKDANPNNVQSLQKVLLQPNGNRPPIFTESELEALNLQATLRAEDMPDDYVPPQVIAQAAAQQAAQPHPLECQCPSCVTVNLHPHDDEGQPILGEDLAEYLEEQAHHADGDQDDAPQQLSMF